MSSRLDFQAGPTTVTRPSYSSANRSIAGNSRLQAGHHSAQKIISTGVVCSERTKVPPVPNSKVKSGAGGPRGSDAAVVVVVAAAAAVVVVVAATASVVVVSGAAAVVSGAVALSEEALSGAAVVVAGAAVVLGTVSTTADASAVSLPPVSVSPPHDATKRITAINPVRPNQRPRRIHLRKYTSFRKTMQVPSRFPLGG